MASTLSVPKLFLPLPFAKPAPAPSQSTHLCLPQSCLTPYKTHCFANFDCRSLLSAVAASFSFARSLLRCSKLAPPSGRFASLSSPPALSGSGSGGGGDWGSSDSDAAAKSLAGETEDLAVPGSDVIVLHVGPQVASATVSFEKSIAFIWVMSEVKVEQDWKQQLGEKLAKHLTTCGFQSDLQGDYAIEGENTS